MNRLRPPLPVLVVVLAFWSAAIAWAQPDGRRPPFADQALQPAACDSSYPDFCIPPPPPDLNCGSAVIAGRHNFTVLQPDPHHLDTDHDGIGCEAALTDTPTPTPPSNPVGTATFTPTATATATPSPTPTVPVSCSPRPPVRVSASRNSAGVLQATITVSSNS